MATVTELLLKLLYNKSVICASPMRCASHTYECDTTPSAVPCKTVKSHDGHLTLNCASPMCNISHSKKCDIKSNECGSNLGYGRKPATINSLFLEY